MTKSFFHYQLLVHFYWFNNFSYKKHYKFIQDKKTFSEALVDTGIDAASRAGTIGISSATGAIVIGALSGGPYGIIAGKIVGGVLGLYPGRKVSTLIKHGIRCKDEQRNLKMLYEII